VVKNNNLIHSGNNSSTLWAGFKKTYPNPNHLTGNARRGKGSTPGRRSALKGGREVAGEGRVLDGWGSAAVLGHGRGDSEKGEKENCRVNHPGRGLYATTAGSPNAHNVAPDASGDHRTHAQRGFRIGEPPDDGHRTLALASGALGHAELSTGRTSPDVAGTLFLRPVSAILQTHDTGRTETASGASSGAPLSPFST